MMYLLALVLPPIAVVACGKPGQALLNIVLCLLGLVPGILHALFVAHNYYADKRQERLIRAMVERA